MLSEWVVDSKKGEDVVWVTFQWMCSKNHKQVRQPVSENAYLLSHLLHKNRQFACAMPQHLRKSYFQVAHSRM